MFCCELLGVKLIDAKERLMRVEFEGERFFEFKLQIENGLAFINFT